MAKFAFMVMPFGRKPTQSEPGKGPAEVDFNALWDKAFFPMLRDLGYSPIRADQDADALIISQMIERLYFSHLVLVDLTSPNGNIYYEMGVRHAMQKNGCVLLATDWSRPLFDVAQMRTIRYPLPAGEISDDMATAIRTTIAPRVKDMCDGQSPVHQVLPGYPLGVDIRNAVGVGDMIAFLAKFQAETRAARLAPSAQRMTRFTALRKRYGDSSTHPVVAMGLLRLLVDSINTTDQWQLVLDYVENLDHSMLRDAYVLEQRALALGKLDRTEEAISELMSLIELAGSTSEREGLLGGRCKQLWKRARDEGKSADAAHWLDRAIDHYQRGMYADLNDFYPASNLARLYRTRMARGDAARAITALHVTTAACQRAMERQSMDPWLRPTHLGVQFDIPDPDKAEELVATIEREGTALWRLEAVFEDARSSTSVVKDERTRRRLAAVIVALEGLLRT